MKACFCCFSAPAVKTKFQKTTRIWHIDAVFKHERFVVLKELFETLTSNNCNIGRFYFVVQVVAKLDMLHRGSLLLFQYARAETKLKKKDFQFSL